MTKVRVYEEDSNGHKVKLVGVFDNNEAGADEYCISRNGKQDGYNLVIYVD